MDPESEPLIRSFKFQPKPSFWRRFPSEITIIGVTLGCFLLVATLLIVVEHKGSSPPTQDELKLDSNLLGSPLNYDKRISGKSIDSKDLSKSNDFMDEWRKSYKVGNMNSLKLRLKAETLLLEMFDKYQKMSKKSLLTEEDFEKVIQDATEGDLPLYLLDTTQEDVQKFYDEWNEEFQLIAEHFESGKESSNKVASKGCPFMKGIPLHYDPVPNQQIKCAMFAEELGRKLGKCIELSFLPRECKSNGRNKCFSTYKYRKIDGTCNNQIHPKWGKSEIPFVRMMAPAYADGVSKIRSAKSGGELPNPRFLSQQLYSKRVLPDSHATFLFLSFALLIDHDLVQTASENDRFDCCDSKNKTLSEKPPKCLEFAVPEGDPFYGPLNVKCMNFIRSIPTNGDCIGRREQLNLATSFLDGSAIYGSTIDRMKSLRSFHKGQLRTSHINNAPFLPFSPVKCGTPDEPLECFVAGDSRVNMFVALTVIHTIWHREHNRLAEELSKLNPKWTDEILFQEARRILIAKLQHITYSEFLPILLGHAALEDFHLRIEPNRDYDGYDDTIDPSVFNVFGSAAFRFGHSLVQDMMLLVGANNKSEGEIPLHKTYFNADLLYNNGLDLILRGAASQKIHSVDSFISEEIRNRLFQQTDRVDDIGHDIAAIGIQRGRDHGLAPYFKWRAACGLSEVRSWEDLKEIMPHMRAEKLRAVYQSVEDIDLIPGALAEHHLEGSLLGPTYLCIIGQQFKKTRRGDRFWYEMQDNIGSFTKEQLQEIYKSSMGRIVCDNSDNIQSVQKFPFRIPTHSNSIENCDDHPRMDLSKWKTSSS